MLTRLIRSLREALDLTTIIVSHDVAETLSIADYIYIVAEGVIQGEGTPAELKQHESAFVRQFLTGAAGRGPVDYQFSHQAYLANEVLFMNAIAALGRRLIERVRGIGVATQMLLQILFSMPTLAWGKVVPLPDVPGWGDCPC